MTGGTRVPESLLPDALKYVMAVRSPISVGIGPSRTENAFLTFGKLVYHHYEISQTGQLIVVDLEAGQLRALPNFAGN